MPTAEAGVLGVFGEPNAAAQAIRALREAGARDVRAAMPAPFPVVVEALGRPTSLVGPFTMTGAVLGGAAGLALAVGTSIDWPIHVGGKPVVSLPAFLVIVFELAVLFGALTNFAVMLFFAGRGRRLRPVPEDPRFSHDRIGVFVPAPPPGAAEMLRAHGAEEVRDVA